MRYLAVALLFNSYLFASTPDQLRHLFFQTPVRIPSEQWSTVFKVADEELYPNHRLSLEQMGRLLEEEEEARWRRRLLEWVFEKGPEDANESVRNLLMRVVRKDGSALVQSHALLLLADARFHSADTRKFLSSILHGEEVRAQVREQALRSLAVHAHEMPAGAPRTRIFNSIVELTKNSKQLLDLAATEALALFAVEEVAARNILERIAAGKQVASTDAQREAVHLLVQLKSGAPMNFVPTCKQLSQFLTTTL